MKKNRLLLLLNVSILATTPAMYSQDASEVVENEGDVTKQQLEQFLSEKTSDTVNESDSSSEKEKEPTKSELESETKSLEESIAAPSATRQEVSEVVEGAEVETTTTQPEEIQDEKTTISDQPKEIEVPVTPAPAGPLVEDTPLVASGLPEKNEPKEEANKAEQAVAAADKAKETETVQSVAAPEAVAVVEAQAPVSLLDTIDIEEGGNWVLKRKALQDTVRKIEDINALYDDIRDTNIVFLQGINTVDVLFTQFSYDVGLDLGKVDQLVQDVSHHLESEREETGDLTEAERDILQKTEDRKKEIEQLRSNIHDIWQAHAQLKEARTLNDDQIIEADRIRKQAWRNFRMIERVLNEVKAEELYHETVQLFEAMQTSYRYLQTRLIPHFEQSIKTIQDKMQSVKKQAEDLQSQGVLLKQQAIQVDRMEKEGIEETQETPAKTTGWLGTIKNVLMAPFNALGSLWGWLTGSSNDMNKFLPDADIDQEMHENKHPEEV